MTNLDYDPYVGRLALGRLFDGTLKMNGGCGLSREDGKVGRVKISGLYTFSGLQRTRVDQVDGGRHLRRRRHRRRRRSATRSPTSSSPRRCRASTSTSPRCRCCSWSTTARSRGRDGKLVTSRQIRERLENESLRNVAIDVRPTDRADAFEVCGRGELQLGILIETMRREGFELLVARPRVLTREIDGELHEPVEQLFLDVPEPFVGVVTEKLGTRKGRLTNLVNHGSGRVMLEFRIPSRGLIGFRGEFLTDTKGSGVMNSLMDGWAPWFGPIPQRTSGPLVADRAGRSTAYATFGMEERGELFIRPGTEVYEGMVIGERNRPGDLDVNITREKKLTNMRSSTADVLVTVRPPGGSRWTRRSSSSPRTSTSRSRR